MSGVVAVAVGILGPACQPPEAYVGDILRAGHIEVLPSNATLILGTSFELSVTVKTASGIPISGRQISWASSNPEVASVSANGVVSAHKVGGPVQISATTDQVTGTAAVIVSPLPITRVTISPTQTGVAVGGSTQLTASAYDASDRLIVGQTFQWQSSSPATADVTTSGIVLGLAEGGPVSITASTEGVSSSATIMVFRPATRLAFQVHPGPGSTGVPLTPPVQVALHDDLGRTVSSATHPVTIALGANTGGATLTGTLTASPENGVATFNNLVLDRAGTGYTLVASAAGLSPATSASFTIEPPDLTIATQPSSTAQSGVAFSQQPRIRVRNGAGVPVGGVAVTAAIASGGGALGGSRTVTSDPNGLVTFSNLSVSGPVGQYALRFDAPGYAGAVSGAIALTAGAATQLSYNQQPSPATVSGQPLAQQPVLLLRDGANNPIAGQAVTATITGAPAGASLIGTTTATTDAGGVASFVGSGLGLKGPAGSYTLTFQAGALNSPASNPIALAAGTPTQLSYNRQPGSTAAAGQAFAQQPILLLRDDSNNPVPNVAVTATITGSPAGASLIGTTTATTNAAGVATFVGSGLGLKGPTGSYTLTFRAGSLASPASNPITLAAGAPTQLTYQQQPSGSATSGLPFSQQPTLLLRDGSNNPVPNTAVTATITGSPAGLTLIGTTVVTTNGSGIASFGSSGLGLTGPAGNYTLTFKAGTLSSPPSVTIALGSAAPSQLSYNQQPSQTAASGQPFAQQPTLLLRDAANNPVAGQVVTATITGAPAGVSLIGTTTATTNAAGVATFVGSGLGLKGPTGSYTLTFRAGTLASPASKAITLLPGAPAQLTYQQQPSGSATSGLPFSQQPTLLLRDGSNNPVPNTAVTATITGSPAGLSLIGTTVVTTNGSGIASFGSSGLGLTGPAGNYTLTFKAGTLSSPPSVTIALGSAATSQLSYNQQPSQTAASGQPFAQQPTLLLRDAANNPVAGQVVTATITGAPAGVSLIGTTTATTNSSGVALFAGSGLGLRGPVGSYSLTFKTATVTSAASHAIALGAGTASKLTITVQPSAQAVRKIPFPQQPVIQLRDDAGNPVSQSGVLVTAAIQSGDDDAKLGGTRTVMTDSSGTARFTNLSIDEKDTYTLRFSSGGLTGATSASVVIQ